MTTRDPGAAVLESVATYLSTALSSLSPAPTVLRGWPETDTAVDLATRPQVAVTQVGVTETVDAPAVLDTVSGGQVTMRLGSIAFSLQLDAWARSREALDALCASIGDALHNDLPYRPHLYLTATDYHARPMWVRLDSEQPDVDGDSAVTGEWRHTWTLTAVVERVQTISGVAAGTITTTPTVTP